MYCTYYEMGHQCNLLMRFRIAWWFEMWDDPESIEIEVILEMRQTCLFSKTVPAYGLFVDLCT